MQRLLLIRHAESEHHIKGLSGGWTDTPLTPHGRWQAERLADRMVDEVADDSSLALVSSDLLRASQTAEIIARTLSVTVDEDANFREINNGSAVGLTIDKARKIELPRTEPVGDWIPYPGGESWNQLYTRAGGALERLSSRYPDSVVVLVTHGLTAAAVVCWWLRLSEESRTRCGFVFGPASVTELGFNQRSGEPTLVRLNDSWHLQSSEGAEQ